ncbi:ATP synthase F1 subunit epsilon [Solitalea canadensis]|uniref:ATP synthase, F1 epsilon subunit n=1 Tax=Solitalea canadensis (strain ATCC 29591 / DSM 3403 / JCM 21819 / LMG 8368 / NBRC 15130 / NCIMB 12057 / USAM 9D) TaxID=929556 RepID=H8KS28_SOLCM|nr:ATP synthase F1 subunit epsilon [Solitalea canadensis]AFD07816.1 ATP synthase, F1 epsilon subunit [Solitalea canadensis DSM 3403]
MILDILTPDKTVFSGEILSVTVPGKGGSFQIWENHAAIISTLENGLVEIRLKDKTQELFNIKGGVVEVLKNKVVLLADGVVEK